MITLIILAAVVVAVLIWLALLPGKFVVSKGLSIPKPIGEVWPLVHDLENWPRWSPWLCLEPSAKVTYKGTEQGVGAMFGWEGALIGSGEMEHLEIADMKTIKQQVRFTKPWKSSSPVAWTFTDRGAHTHVKWEMVGSMPFFLRFMIKRLAVYLEMDYERGLKMLSDLAVKGQVDAEITAIAVVEMPQLSFVGKRAQCQLDQMGSSMQGIFELVEQYANRHEISFDMAISVYHTFDLISKQCDYTSGIVLTNSHEATDPSLLVEEILPCKAIKVRFMGNYEHLPNAWAAAYSYVRAKKLKPLKSNAPFELYLNHPKSVADCKELVTEIYVPIK